MHTFVKIQTIIFPIVFCGSNLFYVAVAEYFALAILLVEYMKDCTIRNGIESVESATTEVVGIRTIGKNKAQAVL